MRVAVGGGGVGARTTVGDGGRPHPPPWRPLLPADKKVCFPPRAVMPTCTGCGGWGVGLLQADGKCRACGGGGGFDAADAAAVGHSHDGVACAGHH